MSKISVEVVYALPEHQYIIIVAVILGSTIEQAIMASGLPQIRHDIDLKSNKIGIYGRPARLDDLVHEGDRIEIYRPLIVDPKELRRQRATGKT